MKKTKKRSAKQKRILIVALFVAAAIVAGSTFAWFSSEDEVTNRLTANADYGVSIVESFDPPENWLPGQDINKDVYATNTGNIPAFVEEEVSGVLAITTETPVPNTTPLADCVELTEEERYVMEAGAFLAYKPTGSAANLGDQIVIRPDDNTTTPPATEFTPDADGLYVFRRSIVVEGTAGTETFEYAGYYYDATNDKYYKISDLNVTPDTTPDGMDDGARTDGNLSAATAGFYKEEKEIVKPVNLEYDAANHRLIATYGTRASNPTSSTELAAAAAAYDTAIHNYQLALEKQNRAANESSAADADVAAKLADLNAKEAALQTALTNQATAVASQAAAEAAYNVLDAEKTEKENRKAELEEQMYGHAGGGTGGLGSVVDDGNYENPSLYYDAYIKDIGDSDDNDRLIEEVNAWLATNPAGVVHTTFATLTYEELSKFTPSAESHSYYQDYVAQQQAKEQYDTYKIEYDAITARLTAIGDDTSGEMGAAKTALNNANTALTAANTAATNAQAARDAANTAYQTALAAAGTPTTNLEAANAEVESTYRAYMAAKAAYERALSPTDTLKININLANDVTAGGVAEKWQILPTVIDANTAHFYYTSILGAGETSKKLIDSVELDSSVTQDMYKSFDFDLNIKLNSAQITYADDNTTIQTDATAGWHATPTLTNNQDLSTPITWAP